MARLGLSPAARPAAAERVRKHSVGGCGDGGAGETRPPQIAQGKIHAMGAGFTVIQIELALQRANLTSLSADVQEEKKKEQVAQPEREVVAR